MTTEERDALLLEFSRFREQNQREHGEQIARIEALRGELLARIEREVGGLRGEITEFRGDLVARMEAQRADSEKAMRVLLLEIVGVAVVGFGAMVGALALLV